MVMSVWWCAVGPCVICSVVNTSTPRSLCSVCFLLGDFAVTGGMTVVLTVSVKKKIESTVTVEMQNSENWFGIQKIMSCSQLECSDRKFA